MNHPLDALARHHPKSKSRGPKVIAFYLVNHSKRPEITLPWLQKVAHALELQSYEDYALFWQSAGVPVLVGSDLSQISKDAAVLAIFDKPDDSQALGWHTYSPEGHIYGKVFLDPVLDNGGTLDSGSDSATAVLSHEMLETTEDPYANALAQIDATTLEWRELCDRTEGDSYDKAGVAVSNFLGPRAFRDGPGPYDRMELLTSPWEVRPGGYVERWHLDKIGTEDELQTIWGERMPAYKRELKMLSHRRGARLARITSRNA